MLNNTAEIFSKPETHQDTSLTERLRLSYSPGPSTRFSQETLRFTVCSKEPRQPPPLPAPGPPRPLSQPAGLRPLTARTSRPPAAPRLAAPLCPARSGPECGGGSGRECSRRTPAPAALLTRQIRRFVLARRDRPFCLRERARAPRCARSRRGLLG